MRVMLLIQVNQQHIDPKTIGMEPTVMSVCDYGASSCSSFGAINDLMIQLVNRHYYDLQMYEGHVLELDTTYQHLSTDNNFLTKIEQVRSTFEGMDDEPVPLFGGREMEGLFKLTSQMLPKLEPIRVTAHQYTSNLVKTELFWVGYVSTAILIKATRLVEQVPMPVIIKVIPLQFPHHYESLSWIPEKDRYKWIRMFVTAPNYALFLKEAWMCCFSKTHLAKYTPCFTCIANCNIVDGLPINLQELRASYAVNPGTIQKQIIGDESIWPVKKWLSIIVDPNGSQEDILAITRAKYGCIEMDQVEGTLENLIHGRTAITQTGLDDFDYTVVVPVLDLGIIFEYLYSKLVAALVGRIILTDDHFANIGYRTVDYARAYRIKSRGQTYAFYIRSTKLIQHIDLERYVFNFSPQDIYTNQRLRAAPLDSSSTQGLDAVRDKYVRNNGINDKGINNFSALEVGAFRDANEHKIILELLADPLIYNIHTFCRAMEAALPKSYLTSPTGMQVVEYYLDLDDDRLRVIDADMVYENV